MAVFKLFDVTGSALAAQNLRLNLVASNLANVDAVQGDPEAVYQARHPVFRSVLMDQTHAGVRVETVVEDPSPAQRRYQPGHPLADAEGYVYAPNVDAVEEMVNMISASRAYQANVEVMNTSKELLLRTLRLGKE